MKKRILAILLCAVMVCTALFSGISSVYAEGEQGGVITMQARLASASAIGTATCTAKTSMNLRKGPGTSYKKTGTLKAKTKVSVYQKKGKWYQIELNGKKHWASGDYLKVTLTNTSKPAEPAGLKAASYSATKVKISWKKVSDASGYYVYRKNSAGKYKKIATLTSASKLSYIDTGLTPAKKYTYTVKAYKKVNGKTISGSYSKTGVTASPTIKKPTVKIAGTGITSVKLSWSKAGGVTGYYVYRKTGSGSYKKIATVKGSSTLTYKDTTVIPGTEYTYTVRGYKMLGGKTYTGSYNKTGVKATPTIAVPKVSAKAASETSIKVSWNKITTSSGYYVYRKTGSADYQKIATIKGSGTLSYTDSGLSKGKNYTYTVRAYKKLNGKTYTGSYSKTGATVKLEAAAEKIGTAVCLANTSMNLRGGPGTSYSKTGTLKANTKVDVYEQSGKWYKIKLDGKYHWASGDYLKVTLKSNSSSKDEGTSSSENKDKYTVYPIAKNTDLKGKIVILDPGHGTGYGGAYKDYREHVINLKHAQLIKTNLENSGAKVVMTRTTDTNVENYSRVSMANKYTMELLRDDRQSDYDALEKKKTALEKEIKAYKSENTSLAKTSEEQLALKAKKQADAQTAEGELPALQESVTEQEGVVSDIQEKIAVLNGNAEGDESADSEETAAELETLNAQLSEAQTELETKKSALQQKQDDIAALKKTAETAAKESAAAESKITKNKKAITEAENDIAPISADMKELSNEITELKRLIKVMQSVIDNPKLADTYYLSPYDQADGRAVHKDLKKIFEYQKDPLLDNVIYVSVHTNATADASASANGTITFYMGNAQNKEYYTGYQESKNKLLATELCDEVVAAAGFSKRGVKINDYFMVREVNIASALLEIGFHTNTADREKLTSEKYQKRVANAVTYAIMDYFN